MGFSGKNSSVRKPFALQIPGSLSHSNFRWFNSVYPRQTGGRSVVWFFTRSLTPQLWCFCFQRLIYAPSSSSSSSSLLSACTQPLQLPLQRLVAMVHLQVAGLQLRLVADDLVLLCLPRPPLLLESRGLGLALAALQQELCAQTLLRRAPAPSCKSEPQGKHNEVHRPRGTRDLAHRRHNSK